METVKNMRKAFLQWGKKENGLPDKNFVALSSHGVARYVSIVDCSYIPTQF